MGLRLTRYVGLDVELTHLSGRSDAETASSWFSAVSPFSAASTTSAVLGDLPPLGDGHYLFPSIRASRIRKET